MPTDRAWEGGGRRVSAQPGLKPCVCLQGVRVAQVAGWQLWDMAAMFSSAHMGNVSGMNVPHFK
jgi:hypothetical protein